MPRQAFGKHGVYRHAAYLHSLTEAVLYRSRNVFQRIGITPVGKTSRNFGYSAADLGFLRLYALRVVSAISASFPIPFSHMAY
jgi:hypothetical protein